MTESSHGRWNVLFQLIEFNLVLQVEAFVLWHFGNGNSKGAAEQFSEEASDKWNQQAHRELAHVTWLVTNPVRATVFTLHGRHWQSSAALEISAAAQSSRCPALRPAAALTLPKTFPSIVHLLIVQPQLLHWNTGNKLTVRWVKQDSPSEQQCSRLHWWRTFSLQVSADFLCQVLLFQGCSTAVADRGAEMKRRLWHRSKSWTHLLKKHGFMGLGAVTGTMPCYLMILRPLNSNLALCTSPFSAIWLVFVKKSEVWLLVYSRFIYYW